MGRVMAMGGEISWLRPIWELSFAKAELGAVSFLVVEVTQAESEPVRVELQPEGSDGARTPSKFWEKVVTPRLATPSVKVKLRVPRLVGPSCNCSEAVIV